MEGERQPTPEESADLIARQWEFVTLLQASSAAVSHQGSPPSLPDLVDVAQMNQALEQIRRGYSALIEATRQRVRRYQQMSGLPPDAPCIECTEQASQQG